MRLLTPWPTRTPLQRANPLAKLVAALVLLVALFVSLDAVTAAIVLVALVRRGGHRPLGRRAPGSARGRLIIAWPIAVAAFNVLFAAEQLGPTVIAIGPVRIGAETLAAASGSRCG